MPKITCTCGHIIPDNTDYISYKGYLLADQDYDDFMDEIEGATGNEFPRKVSKYFQEIFQCTNCKNIIIIRDNKQFDFKPIDTKKNVNVLNSYLKEKWLGIIAANFYNGQGDIFWQTNKESGFRQELTLEELKKIYFNKLSELKSLHILRHSFLRINGEIEHEFELKK